MTSSSASAYEKFLLQKNTLSANDVMDYIGTAYLRDNNLEKAVTGFKKIPEKYYRQDPYRTYLAANPFASLDSGYTRTHQSRYSNLYQAILYPTDAATGKNSKRSGQCR